MREKETKSGDTILIVEDHDALRDSLKSWIGANFPECLIVLAGSGEEALDSITRIAPDLILMDVHLPGMHGIEASRRIKSIVPDTQIIMLSIYEDQPYRQDAAAAGSSAYISKRKMGTELIPRIAEALHSRPACEKRREESWPS